MVLISEVIMVVTTLVTLCQSAPARRGTKTRHNHGHNVQNASTDSRTIIYNNSESDHDDQNIWPSDIGLASSSSAGNWTNSIDQPGTSTLNPRRQFDENGNENDSDQMTRHPNRHRQNHDSARRRHHKHQNYHNQEHDQENQRNNNRGRYEHLCETIMKTVHLNTDHEEYNPPFYVEVRCRQPQQSHSYSSVQKCAFNLLHCVQTYTTLNFSRRKADGTDCWQPFTLDVPSGCECMWPIEEFGSLSSHDDL